MAELTIYDSLNDLIGKEVSYHDEEISLAVTDASIIKCKITTCYLQSESPFNQVYVCVDLEPLYKKDIDNYGLIETGLDNIYIN
jgi:hypothetical protein